MQHMQWLQLLAQGTNSTFEDAWVLADCLSNASDFGEAFANYEQRRIPPAKNYSNSQRKRRNALLRNRKREIEERKGRTITGNDWGRVFGLVA